MDIIVYRSPEQEPNIFIHNACHKPYSVSQWRNALASAACHRYGREGRDWRMVQDTTVIGFHVKALLSCYGEVLELH